MTKWTGEALASQRCGQPQSNVVSRRSFWIC